MAFLCPRSTNTLAKLLKTFLKTQASFQFYNPHTIQIFYLPEKSFLLEKKFVFAPELTFYLSLQCRGKCTKSCWTERCFQEWRKCFTFMISLSYIPFWDFNYYGVDKVLYSRPFFPPLFSHIHVQISIPTTTKLNISVFNFVYFRSV